MRGDPYGCHRVLQPHGVFPQAAHRLSTVIPIYENEILIEVERLNLDSASFFQIREACHANVEKMSAEILKIVRDRGKMHNPVTNSGGTLLGKVIDVGPALGNPGVVRGDRVTTLVSLTLTPLQLEAIQGIDLSHEQVMVTGHAVIFESGILAKMPSDLPEPLALSVFDVCGAPALSVELVRENDTVVILGAGKAGVLTAAALKEKYENVQVIFLEKSQSAIEKCSRLDCYDHILEVDLTNPVMTQQAVSRVTDRRMADLVVNCVNVPKTEMASVLAAKKNGTVLFFNMTTHFPSAVLGAEGVGHETRLVMGNGYFPGHADLALNLVRHNKSVREWFETKG